jgi:pimeloyl-CoA dehydrogenase small subunit
MEFDFSEDQRLMAASIGRLLSQHYAFGDRTLYCSGAGGWSREMWRRYAELGLLAIPFAEDLGGLGGTAVDTMTAMNAFGRALILEPYLATVVLAGGVLQRGSNRSLARRHVPKIMAGEAMLALACHEWQSRHDPFDIVTSARRDGSGWRLNGEKSLVLNGADADHIVVSARVNGSRRGRDGVALFLVDAHAPGLSRRGYKMQDDLRAAEISFDNVAVGSEDAIGAPGRDAELLERVLEEGIAAVCAEAVGAMDALHELTVDYLKQRRQFGRPLGDFQVLQHRAVDMLMMLEQARSMSYYATMMLDHEDDVQRSKAISATKVQIGRSARFIGEQAIQLHGGIGMTMEYKAGHYFKRLTMIDMMFGDWRYHLQRLSQTDGLFERDPGNLATVGGAAIDR